MKILKISSIIFFAMLIVVGCKKDKEDKLLGDWQSSSDQAMADAVFQDIEKVVDEQAQNDNHVGRACPNVSLSSTDSFPTTMTIDFGSSGCLASDGRFRKGQIIAEFTGKWRDSGTSVTITLANYEVNGYGATGTKVITNNGRNSSGNLSYTTVVTNASITSPSGGTSTWNSTRTLEWVEGESTTFLSHGTSGILDDVYDITGSASGVNQNGLAYTMQTISPLRKRLDCKWITQGKLQVTPQGYQARTIDFGSGACDDEATASVGNFSTIITLR